MALSTAIEDFHPNVLACALRCMDGPTLAAIGCSSSLFRSLSTDPSIWHDLCLEAWPSIRLLPIFPLLSPRSFFAHSFPFPDTDAFDNADASDFTTKLSLPERVFSVVDIHYAGVPIFSRVIETDTSCLLFRSSVFQIDALECEDLSSSGLQPTDISPTGLELSWILIYARTRQAVNVSSRSPVAVDRHRYTGEVLVRFVTVLNDCAVSCAVSVVVTCGEEAGQVLEVSLTVEHDEGAAMNRRESLGILTVAMQGRKRRRGNGEEERKAKWRYEEYLKRKEMMKERKVRREGLFDLCCTGSGALVFLAYVLLCFACSSHISCNLQVVVI